MARHGIAEPRIFTPELQELTPQTSWGFSVIYFAETVLSLPLLPWQKWLLVHMLELDESGGLRFRTVVVLVARQNGKSTLSQVIALWMMYVQGVPLVIGCAQDLSMATDIWQGAVDLVESTPELNALKESVVRVNGQQSLILTTGERYKVKAANRKAGRGLSGDLILLDELREHQSWDAWAAITKTTMARAAAMVLTLSNAGDASSIVLRYLRKMGHAAIGDPDGINAADEVDAHLAEDRHREVATDDTLALFEWSAPPGCDVNDRDGWAAANPALGHTISERTIAAAAHTDPQWVFRTEVLCQWSDGSAEGPFPSTTWLDCSDPASQIVGERVAAAVDVSFDRSRAHIAAAGFRADGLPHVEIIASRAGVDWVLPWLLERSARWTAVTGQSRGAPVSGLLPDLAAAGLPVIDWAGPDLGAGSGAFYDLVCTAGLRHLPQPVLDVPAAIAVTRPSGDGWLWDRRHSPGDIAPLIAATAAVWLLRKPVDRFVSAYETTGVGVI